MAGPLPPLYADVARAGTPPGRSASTAERTYIDAVYNAYFERKSNIKTGTCIAYDAALKEITVELDVEKNGVGLQSPQDVKAVWGRPKLTETEVVGKRVKVFFHREFNKQIQQEELKEIALTAIAPSNAPLTW